MLEIGDRLKSYEPLWENWYKDSYIGGGNFGKVYKLKQDFLGVVTYSAVKIISINLENEMVAKDRRQSYIEERKRFVAEEIKNMYKLKGRSNLVHCLAHAIRDVYDDNGDLVGFDILIRMDFYRSLPDYLKHTGAMDAGTVEKLAYQIGMALQSMHEINMLHRDIKPDNIYLDEKTVFYLGDFGVSKQVDSSSYSTLAGTQPFIAPEVWHVTQSNKNYSKTADIYSYGITLYYLLNENRLPLVTPESNLNQIEQAVFDRLGGKPFPPPKNGSPKLKAVVMKCCEYKPENRFQSMDEVLSALRNEGFTYTQIGSGVSAAPASATVYAGSPRMTGQSFSPVQPQYVQPGSQRQPSLQQPSMQPGSQRQPVVQQPSMQPGSQRQPQPVIRQQPSMGGSQRQPYNSNSYNQAQPVPAGGYGSMQGQAPAAAKKKSKLKIIIPAVIAAAAIAVVVIFVLLPMFSGAKKSTIKGTVNYDGDYSYSTFKVDSKSIDYIPDSYFKGYDEDGCSITLEFDTADVSPYNVYSYYLFSPIEYGADENLYSSNNGYITGVPVGNYGGVFDNNDQEDFAEYAALQKDGVFYVRMDKASTLKFNLSAKCVKKILSSKNKGLSFQCYGLNITSITIDKPKKETSSGIISQDFS